MNRKELVKTLSLVGHALAPNAVVPMFANFMFSGKHVTAYNDQICIDAPCQTDQAYALNGKTLLGLLTNSKAEEVIFSISEKAEFEVNIKAGRSTFKLPYQPKEEFLFAEPTDKFKSISTDKLKEAMDACLITASKDNTQPAFMGVCLNLGEGALYSCDGDAISQYSLPTKGEEGTYMLPNAFCEAVLSIVEETKELISSFKLSKDWAKATIGDFNIWGRLIEVDSPLDYEDQIQKTLNGNHEFSAVPKALSAALDRARVLADAESAKTTFTVEGGRLKLLTETHMGVVRDSMDFKHADVVANTSAALVQRSIKLCDQISILENCTAYKGDRLLVVVSNME